MCRYVIAADTSCDMNEEIIKKYDLNVISIPVILEDKEIENFDSKEFYKNIRLGKRYITASINPEKYINFFENLYLKHHKPIIYICLASGLSSTINNAKIAKDLLSAKYLDFDLRIIDSKMASSGQIILIKTAYECNSRDVCVDEVVDKLEILATNLNTVFFTDTLKYFIRGGRVSKIKGFIGELFKINPILDCKPNGGLEVIAKARGKKKTISKALDIIGKTVIDPSNQELIICHADCKEDAIEFANICIERFKFKDYLLFDMGPVIGAHTGPNLISAYYLGKPKKEKGLIM